MPTSENGCTCTDIRAVIHCDLTRGDNPCISADTQPHTEPVALNSDALTTSLANILGTNTTITNEL